MNHRYISYISFYPHYLAENQYLHYYIHIKNSGFTLKILMQENLKTLSIIGMTEKISNLMKAA